ncbi:hypothetical protein ACTMTI_44395 [Nonomuraea sp. H19]|uniref:hypothetical protein n=1 Tax=Nonomuraea sp. H19 TaxID=3452206 RepID=UPI003F8CC01B
MNSDGMFHIDESGRLLAMRLAPYRNAVLGECLSGGTTACELEKFRLMSTGAFNIKAFKGDDDQRIFTLKSKWLNR